MSLGRRQCVDTLLENIDATNARYAAQAAPRRVPLHSVAQA